MSFSAKTYNLRGDSATHVRGLWESALRAEDKVKMSFFTKKDMWTVYMEMVRFRKAYSEQLPKERKFIDAMYSMSLSKPAARSPWEFVVKKKSQYSPADIEIRMEFDNEEDEPGDEREDTPPVPSEP